MIMPADRPIPKLTTTQLRALRLLEPTGARLHVGPERVHVRGGLVDMVRVNVVVARSLRAHQLVELTGLGVGDAPAVFALSEHGRRTLEHYRKRRA